ncbi:MAG: pitrilysin family protein [Acidobacteriota bacterium]
MRRHAIGILAVCALLSACSPAGGPRSAEGIITLSEPESPFVAFNIWVRCGSQDDPKGKEGLAAFTANYLSDSSTRNNSYEQILEKLYPMAAGYGANVDKEMTTFTGRIHKDHLDAYYALFKDAILAPAFREEDFNRIKSQTVNFLKQIRRFSNDEELTKELLFREIYRGTPYEHPEEGYVASVESITLQDVQDFYAKHYTRNNIVAGVCGGYPEGYGRKVRADFDSLPVGTAERAARPEPAPIDGIHFLLVEKNIKASPVSFGFPIPVLRPDRDFFPLMLFNSWMGEHRNSFSRLYQVIRETRGMNYGDYSYVEAYPRGYATQVPPVNVSRRSQIFEVWIRPIAMTQPGTLHDRTLFALRAGLREVSRIVETGMTAESFEETRGFLKNYTANFGATGSRRLAYRMDDSFYGYPDPGFLASIKPGLDALTLDQVNAAIRKYLQAGNMWVVIITQDAEGMKRKLLEGDADPHQLSGAAARPGDRGG